MPMPMQILGVAESRFRTDSYLNTDAEGKGEKDTRCDKNLYANI